MKRLREVVCEENQLQSTCMFSFDFVIGYLSGLLTKTDQIALYDCSSILRKEAYKRLQFKFVGDDYVKDFMSNCQKVFWWTTSEDWPSLPNLRELYMENIYPSFPQLCTSWFHKIPRLTTLRINGFGVLWEKSLPMQIQSLKFEACYVQNLTDTTMTLPPSLTSFTLSIEEQSVPMFMLPPSLMSLNIYSDERDAKDFIDLLANNSHLPCLNKVKLRVRFCTVDLRHLPLETLQIENRYHNIHILYPPNLKNLDIHTLTLQNCPLPPHLESLECQRCFVSLNNMPPSLTNVSILEGSYGTLQHFTNLRRLFLNPYSPSLWLDQCNPDKFSKLQVLISNVSALHRFGRLENLKELCLMPVECAEPKNLQFNLLACVPKLEMLKVHFDISSDIIYHHWFKDKFVHQTSALTLCESRVKFMGDQFILEFSCAQHAVITFPEKNQLPTQCSECRRSLHS